ncbi:hypothetical protein NQZ68_007683 [Dissostichus eleginoides]|nr:hypothetical protein NQZ68_007683 [Dissostichus eleginoides]
MTNNLCTQRRWDSEGGCQESEEETATPLQPLDSMKKEREPGANRGYNEGGMLPSPPAKGCQYWTYQTLNGRISLPMKIKSMTCFPWLSSL